MRSIMSMIDMVIECRDYRIPLSSQNPLLEESLPGKHRLIVYTKQDLGSRNLEQDVKVFKYKHESMRSLR